MGKITGLERTEDLPEKVLLLYDAVVQLIAEGEDMSNIKVSLIAQRAGIGKGTAYDYFESKEDIIACAIAYLLKKVTEEIHRRLMSIDSFQDQMNYLLDMTEEKLSEQQCFLRFVHLMTDTSAISQLLRDKVGREQIEKYLPVSTLKTVLKKAQEEGEIRDDLPMDYMVYAVFLRMVTYMAFISVEEGTGKRTEEMRPFIFRGLMEEFRPRQADLEK